MEIDANSTDVSIPFLVLGTSGSPVENLVAADLTFWYRRGVVGAKVSISLADLSDPTDEHSDGGIIHVSDGWYRLDSPDAAFVRGVRSVRFGGSAGGSKLFVPDVDLVSVTHTTGL